MNFSDCSRWEVESPPAQSASARARLSHQHVNYIYYYFYDCFSSTIAAVGVFAMSNKAFFNNFKTTTYKDVPLRGGQGHSNSEIILLSINNTGNRIVNSRTDKSIRIWKSFLDKMSDPIVVEQPHTKAVECVSWHPKHEYTFATVGRDDFVKIWKISSNACLLEREIRVVKNQENQNDAVSKSTCQIVKYSVDGEIMAVVDRDSTVLLFATSTYNKVCEFRVQELVYAFEWFNAGHEFFILGLHDGTAPIYACSMAAAAAGDAEEAVSVTLKHTIRGHRSSITSLAVDPRGKYFVIGSNEGVASIWSTATMLNTSVITSVNEAIAHIDISRDGTYITLTFDSGSNARVFEQQTIEEIYEIENSLSGDLAVSTFKWFPHKTSYIYTSDRGRTMGFVKK